MNETMTTTPWKTLSDASSYTHRGQRYLKNEVKAGRLRAARIGGRGELLFRVEWLDDWVESQMTPVIVSGTKLGFRR